MNPDPPKRSYYDYGASGAVVMFFLFLFLFAKWGPAIPFSVLTQPKGEPMVVTGEGKVTTVPDLAVVSAGIEARGQILKQVQNDANKKSQKLVAALKNMRIDERDIKTTGYNIYPQTDYQNSPLTVSGYQVSISYSVKIRDIEKVNEVLTTVTEEGANLVGGVTFDLSDDAKAKALTLAREDAVKTAKQNAQSLAKASGVSLGKIINVTESQGNFPRPVFMTAEAKSADAGGTPIQPDVQPGTTEIDLTISLSYEVR